MSDAANTSSATGIQLPAPVVRLCKAYAAQDADLILHSAVGDDHRYIGKRIITAFKVHKEKLRGSPVFRDMLECQDDLDGSGSLPVVELTEEAGVIQNLLEFLYGDIKTIPARDGDLLSGPAAIYEATIKYQMPLAQVLLETIIKHDLYTWDLEAHIDLYRIASREGRTAFQSLLADHIAEEATEDWPLEEVEKLSTPQLMRLFAGREAYLAKGKEKKRRKYL